MNRKAASPDSGRPSDWGSHQQTDKPWEGNPEKEQRSGHEKPDLEEWQESNTQ